MWVLGTLGGQNFVGRDSHAQVNIGYLSPENLKARHGMARAHRHTARRSARCPRSAHALAHMMRRISAHGTWMGRDNVRRGIRGPLYRLMSYMSYVRCGHARDPHAARMLTVTRVTRPDICDKLGCGGKPQNSKSRPPHTRARARARLQIPHLQKPQCTGHGAHGMLASLLFPCALE